MKIRGAARKRRGSAVTHVQAIEVPYEAADERRAAAPRADDTLPYYYPFAPSLSDDED
ncbi:MAG: hypothetical protein ACN4G0_07500 [Polyangiales bacterium]